MIPSNWRRRRALKASQSVSGGDELTTQLGDLVAAFNIESSRWPDIRAEQIWLTGNAIDSIRLDYVRGLISKEYAIECLAQGVSMLTELQRERSSNDHPAGKARP